MDGINEQLQLEGGMSRWLSCEMLVCSWWGLVLVGLDNEQVKQQMRMSSLGYRVK